ATRTKFSYQDSDWLDTRPPEISWVDYYQRVTQEHKRARKTKELINSIYSTELPYKIKLSNIFQTWRFNIYVEKKEEILKTIQEAGFFASGHYESLTGIFAPGQAPIAEKVYKNIINLFNDRYFDTNKASNLSKLLTSLHLTPPSQF
ncbi:hypothetical protein, partial [Pseudomonas asplenii]|uniref:hypothetical protein n=1 Tax=Pseudomonas asplenii TaxID=53407 RepID=UPI001E628845